MNLPLTDPVLLAQDIPESLVARLRSSGQAVCLRFSWAGDLLASGTAKGTIAIFDLETHGVARKLKGHTNGRTVQSLSWEKSGRYLLSSSIDWKVILWDLKDGSRVRVLSLGAPVYIAELHPANHLLCVAALYEYRPVLADLTAPQKPIQHALPNLPKRAPHEQEANPEKADAKHFTTVAAFTPTGSHIITGTTKGWLNVISTSTRQTIYSTRLCSKPILLIRLSASGRDLLVNASDTIIRTIRLPDLSSPTLQPDEIRLDIEHKFQDVVNRLSWNHVSFSGGSAEYVMASTLMNHDIYIWERTHGSLVKILEGPKEELGAVEWHPSRPMVAATGVESGRVYFWGVLSPQRWSALAPDFLEVEENEEYVEQEDEFDIHPVEELQKRRLDQEDEEVDVLTVDAEQLERETGRRSDVVHGNGSEVFRMPVLLDMNESDSEDEMVAIGTGQFRRKSTSAREGSEFLDGEEGDEGGEADESGEVVGRKRRR
ncbi:chromatin binding protein [Elasticomyces elasticus]|nr:chromatin binding protein [Elasticomyces elasticus]